MAASACRRDGLRAVCRGVRLLAGDRDRDRRNQRCRRWSSRASLKRSGAGVITTSGALGILIPPSIVMVIYCVATGGSIALDPAGHRVSSASVGQMFMAACHPGLMLSDVAGSSTTFYRAWKLDYPRLPKASWTERFVAFRKCMWGLLLILIVLGGIYAGMFTPTEAAAISAVYAFVIAVFVYKDMPLRDVPKVLLGSANMSAMISLHHHKCGAVLVPDGERKHSAADRGVDHLDRRRLDHLPPDRQSCCCCLRAT